MDTGNHKASQNELDSDNEHDHTAHEIDASFRKTYESIEQLFTSKRSKLASLKQLMVAEAKLSLSSLFVAIGLGVLLLVTSTTVWLLINLAIGWTIFHFTGLATLTVAILIILNVILSFFLVNQIKKVWKLVGFPTATATLNEVS